MMLRRRPLLGLALSALGLALTVPARAEDAAQILLNSFSTRAAFQGEQVTELMGANARPRASRRPQVQRVYRDGNVMRIDFPGGLTVYDDGRELIRYRAQDNTYEKQPSTFNARKTRAMQNALRTGRAAAAIVGEETIAGRAAWIVTLDDSKGKLPALKVWIDKEHFVQLRQDLARDGGALTTRFLSISFIRPTAAQLAFTLPPTAQLQEGGFGRPIGRQAALKLARRWGGLLEPATLPPGYRFRAFYSRSVRGLQGVVAVYDGPARGQSISVFQRPSQGSMGMVGGRKEKFRVLSVKKGGVDVTLVGPEDMADSELQRVMGSIPESP